MRPAHARPQGHELEGPERPVLVLQHDAGADGRGQQHRGGEEDGVAPAGQADQERPIRFLQVEDLGAQVTEIRKAQTRETGMRLGEAVFFDLLS